MKRIFVLFILCIFLSLDAYAALSLEQQTEPDYIINNGYSEAMAEQILILKNRAYGKPAEPLYDKKYTGISRIYRNIYEYFDPAQDTEERIHHNIRLSPSPKDL